MKNLSLKSKILAAAFAIGGLTAGATEVAQSVSNANQQQYEWEGSGPEGSGTFEGTVDAAREHYGCREELGTVCATGSAQGQLPVKIYKP